MPGRGDAESYTHSEEEGSEGYRPGGYHPVQPGEMYNRRYEVLYKLGWGHFSTVWMCRDFATDGFVALKVQRSAPHYIEAAHDEIELLAEAAKRRDLPEWQKTITGPMKDVAPTQRFTGVVELLDCFEHHGPHGKHVCMVFEAMGPNLLSLIKRFNFKGVPMETVRLLAKHVLLGLDYLHRICGIIHTDLKPENVLVACPNGVPLDKYGAPADVSDVQGSRVPLPTEAEEARAEPGWLLQNKAGIDQPYMRPYLRPSVSDPSLLSSVGDSKFAWNRTPYHYAQTALGESGILTGQSLSGLFSRKDVRAASTSEAVKLDVFKHETVIYKLADLGNACWIDHHFSEEIQTRQYRAPETILKSGYGTSADMWSFACMIFELVTGDYLFDPKGSEEFPRDEDHMALFAELLGPAPKGLIARGQRSASFFNRKGELRHIKRLRIWPLEQVLVVKYKMPAAEAKSLASFLLPMLRWAPEERRSAQEMLSHPWLSGASGVEEKKPPAAASSPEPTKELTNGRPKGQRKGRGRGYGRHKKKNDWGSWSGWQSRPSWNSWGN